MHQIVRSPGIIHDTIKWEGALGNIKVQPEPILDILWRAGWVFNRVGSDFLRLPDTYSSVDLKQKPIFYNAGLSQARTLADVHACAHKHAHARVLADTQYAVTCMCTASMHPRSRLIFKRRNSCT